MYKYTDNTQSNFLDFNQPIGLHMNPENRWVKMADAIPWGGFEKKYSNLFKGKESSGKKDDDHNNPPSGGEGDGQDTKQGQFPENKGTLMLDATCAPYNIRYPQDFSLLNEARESDEISDTPKISCRTVMHRHRKRALSC